MFVTVARPSQGWVFLDLCIILLRNVPSTGAMVVLETRLGGNVLPVAYFPMYDMIKASASIYSVLPSAIAFIFSSTFLSIVAAIALCVDLFHILPLLLLGFFSSELLVFRHSRSLSFFSFERLRYSGHLWYHRFTPVFFPFLKFYPKGTI